MRLAAALLLASVFLLAGCAETGQSPTSSTTTAPTTTSPTAATGTATATSTTGTGTTGTATGAPGSRTHHVNLTGNQFQPSSLSVKAGDTVHWMHQDGQVAHTVTDDGGAFDSHPNCLAGLNCMKGGDTFQRAYSSAGTFPYHCKVHSGMKGTVTVA